MNREFFLQHKKYFVYGALFVVCAPILVVVLCFAAIHFSTRAYLYSDIEKLPHTQAAVILGAAILKSGDLSPVYRHRADTAIAVYKAGKADKILVTGDNSTVEHNEVNPVQKYLVKFGVRREDIFLDHAGFDTYSSMYRARDVFVAETFVVVSQGFHLPRAIYIARALGTEAYGIEADKGSYLFRNDIREVGADVKAVFNLLFNREPKYLGEQIPITGIGNGSEFE